MDSIADLLAKRQPQEPPEIRAIKNYIKESFNETVGVTLREKDIVITVRSSALAGALRMHVPRINNLLDAVLAGVETSNHAKRHLIFRVGTSG